MIALNEIISNKEIFENKYKIMNKNIKLDDIIKLEEIFIALDKKSHEMRSKCNILCGEIAKTIEVNGNVNEKISEINQLNKEIIKLEKKSSSAMNKINKKLKKLPNIPLESNILNIQIKTKLSDFNKNDFIKTLAEISPIESNNLNEFKYLNSIKKVVYKAEVLPKIIKTKSNKTQNFVMICGTNALEYFNNIQNILSNNAKFLTIKSIKSLNKSSSKEICALLSDNTRINLNFSGEFISREKSIKLYDKKLDMTKFVNIIRILIK